LTSRSGRSIAAIVLSAAASCPAAPPRKAGTLWIEAEAYTAQAGSTAPKYLMPGASGGAIVDNNWGGGKGHFLRYDLALPADLAKLCVTLRYARATAGEALVKLILDGRGDRGVTVRLPSTGGWGFHEHEWSLACAELPPAAKGAHKLEIRSVRDRNNVNFDGFFLAARPVRPAGLPDSAGRDASRDLQALRETARRLPPIAFVVQPTLGNPDGVVRYHSRPVVRAWGCAIYVYDPARPDRPPRRIFHDAGGAIFDMNVSYDARTLLFTFRRAQEDNWHLYEIPVEPGASARPRQITSGPYHDVWPAELPDGRLVFASTRVRSFNVCAQELSACLFVADRDGSNIRQITVNTLNDISPQVLPNGQILYTRWEYVDRDVKWRQSLWTVNPDGTNVQLYFGNTVRDPAVFWQARHIPGRAAVVATFAPHHGWPMGAIGIVTNGFGVETPRGAGFRWITPEYPRIGDDGGLTQWAYRDPFPVSSREFLVSYGGGLTGRERRFGIYLLNDRGAKVRLWQHPTLSCTYPLPLRPRPVPPKRPLLACRPGVTTGAFLLRNVYRGLGGAVRPGEIRHLRIMEQPAKFPVNESSARVYEMTPVMGRRCYYRKRCLGVVPVEADGSAHFIVPALRELYFQALDAAGRAVQSMGSAVNLVPGETQTCIGCHENRSTAPPRGAPPLAARKPPAVPRPYAWGNAGDVDFVKIVQPVLDAHCVKCHSGPTPKRRLDLSGDKTRFFNMAYDSIFDRRLVHTIVLTRNDAQVIPPKKAFAYASRLRSFIEGTHPKHKHVRIPRDQRERLYVWMDSNANYYGTHERTRPGTRGGRDLWAAPWFAGEFLPLYRRHCGSCHGRDLGGSQYPQDSAVLNLTRPENSRALTAHLAKAGGGFGLSKPKDGRKPPCFKDTTDPVYQAMLAAIRQGRRDLLARPRMDMPGAKPRGGHNDWGRFRGTRGAAGGPSGKFLPD